MDQVVSSVGRKARVVITAKRVRCNCDLRDTNAEHRNGDLDGLCPNVQIVEDLGTLVDADLNND